MTDPVTVAGDRYDRGLLAAAAFVTLAWHVATSLPTALSGWPLYRPPAVGLGVWLGYALVGAASAVALLRGRAPRGPTATAVCLGFLAGAVTVALASPTGSVLDSYSWAYQNAGWFALLALWRRRFAELVAFYVLLWSTGAIVQVVAGQTGRLDVARFLMASYGVAVLQLTMFAGARSIASLARQAALAREEQTRIDTDRDVAQAIQAARRERATTVQRAAADLLAGLAEDRLDLTDAGTRRSLRLAVSRLRRLLVETDDVPDPLLHEVRACADEAERRGVAVDLQALAGDLPDLPLPVRRALTEPVAQVLADTDGQARVTVVAGPTEVVVAVVADAAAVLDLPASPPCVDVDVELEGGRQWAQARWTLPSPSR